MILAPRRLSLAAPFLTAGVVQGGPRGPPLPPPRPPTALLVENLKKLQNGEFSRTEKLGRTGDRIQTYRKALFIPPEVKSLTNLEDCRAASLGR